MSSLLQRPVKTSEGYAKEKEKKQNNSRRKKETTRMLVECWWKAKYSLPVNWGMQTKWQNYTLATMTRAGNRNQRRFKSTSVYRTPQRTQRSPWDSQSLQRAQVVARTLRPHHQRAPTSWVVNHVHRLPAWEKASNMSRGKACSNRAGPSRTFAGTRSFFHPAWIFTNLVSKNGSVLLFPCMSLIITKVNSFLSSLATLPLL